VETFTLYGGQVTLQYDDAKHKYVAIEQADGRVIVPPSITTVLGVINKPALVQWAVNCAIDYLRNCLCEGEFSTEDIDRFLDEAKYAHRFVKQQAADIGSEAHNWLEAYWRAKLFDIQGPDELPENQQVRNCVEAALKWIDSHKITPLLIERALYSRKHEVAGRMDKLAFVDGRLSVVDWKSSTGLWPEYVLQTSAYAKIYEEEMGVVVEDRWLVKLGKYDGEFQAKQFTKEECDKDFEAFLGAVAVYKRLQQL
jgi:hypothetical protein